MKPKMERIRDGTTDDKKIKRFCSNICTFA